MTDVWEQRYNAVREQAPSLERLRLGLIWALCHVHTPVSQAEHEFASYVWDGALPDGTMLPDHKHKGIESVNAYVMGLDFEWWLSLSDVERVTDVVRHVWGLGAPKATFGLTSAGYADIACLDTHIIDYRLVPLITERDIARARKRLLNSWRTNMGRATQGVQRYVAAVTRAYGMVAGSGREQWRDYAILHADFARDGHAVFFEAVGVSV